MRDDEEKEVRLASRGGRCRGSAKLSRARSRPYRSHILQVNMRLEAL